MYPPEAQHRGLDPGTASHARETLAQLKSDGVVAEDVDLQVVTGNGWVRRSTPPTGWRMTCWPSAGRLRRNRSGVPRLARLKDPAAQPGSGADTTRLVLRRAAVDGDLAARDRGRTVTGKPRDHVGNLLGHHEFLKPLLAVVVDGMERHRREAVQILRILGEDGHHRLLLHHRRLDRVWVNRVDPNPELPHLDRQCIRQRH